MATTKIFVNLPVKNLERSMDFFKKIGYSFNEQFTDATAACMVIGEDIYAMLLTHAKFAEFTKKEIVDASRSTEVLIAPSAESRDAVDKLVDAVLGAGGKEARPAADYGFMYQRAFDDLDGHTWEIVWMDPTEVQ